MRITLLATGSCCVRAAPGSDCLNWRGSLVGTFADMTHHRLHDGQLAHHIDERCDSAQCQQGLIQWVHAFNRGGIYLQLLHSFNRPWRFFSTTNGDASSRCSCAFKTAAHSQKKTKTNKHSSMKCFKADSSRYPLIGGR